MDISRSLDALCICTLLLLTSITANAAIVYNVDRTIGNGTVTGYIETDGTLGVLSSANVTDWSLTLSAPDLWGGSPYLIDFATQTQTLISGPLTTATSTQLLFDFSASVGGFFLLQGGSPETNYWCIERSGCTGGISSEHIGRDDTTFGPTQTVVHSGTIAFAEVASVPVPAAVWLFGSGLLGLFGVARRKKAA